MLGAGSALATLKIPFVRVPVLSKTQTPSLAIASCEELDLKSIPCFAAPPIDPKKVRGTEIIRAQGQETTKNSSAI